MLAGGLLNKKYNFTRPSEDLILSDADIREQFNQIMGDLSMTQQGQIAGIKQVGAANRLPAGATQGRIAQTAQQTARGAAGAKVGLKEAQRRSKIDYYNLLNQYEQQQAGQQGAQQQFYQSGLGALGQILTLWQGGMFNKPGQQQGGQPGQPGRNTLSQYPYQMQGMFQPMLPGQGYDPNRPWWE